MKKHILSILSVSLLLQASIPAFANPPGNMDKADYLFRHSAYKEAMGEYEKIKSAAPRRKDAVLDAKIGDCYRLTKNPAEAANWYARAVGATRGAAKEVKLHYGEVLMNMQCYEDAAYWIGQYIQASPQNRRAANMLAGCRMAIAAGESRPQGTATFLTINTDGADFAPAIFSQGLVFTSNAPDLGSARKDKWTGKAYNNIYKVSCTGGDCNTNYEVMGGKVSSKYHDGVASFTGDGKQMFFTRTMEEEDLFGQQAVADGKGTVHLEIMIAEDYDAASKQFKKVIPYPFNNKDYSTIHPAVSPDGSMLIFASDMPGGEGSTDLYMSRKNAQGEWTKPVNMGRAINTEGEEMFPVFLDSKHISFASNGLPGYGGHDVFYSSLNDQDGSWTTPINASLPVNSSYDDMSLTMDGNGLGGYFASNRPASKGSDNIYRYFNQSLFLNAQVVDSFTNIPVNDATVSIQSNVNTSDLNSNENGYVTGELTSQTIYQITVRKTGYHDYTTTLAGNQFTRVKDTANNTFKLVPDANVTYTAQVVDEASGLPIENPVLVITKDGSNERDTVNLATSMPFNKTLEAGTTYRINAVKDQYYSDEKVIRTTSYGPDRVIHIADTLMMCKLSIGAICQIGDIYYDFNASDIRPDALPSLDKVLKLLHENKTLKLQINSHTDCRGTDEYNKQLSNRRAESVIKYLAEKGISPNRLKAKGYGETMAATKCDDCEACSEEQHQKNRRTEFLVLGL